MEERNHYKGNEVALPDKERATNLKPDKLPWQDKLPLTLALVAQSYVIFIWYLRSTKGIHQYVDFIIALAAGIALDWLTVSTVMGRREGRTSIWSWLTSVGTFVGSAMIAYDTYAVQWWPLDGKALLHVCFPLVVLLYSLHLAAPKQQKAPPTIIRVSGPATVDHPALQAAPNVPELTTGAQDALVPVPKAKNASLSCPSCGASLESIGELGAAKRWGHCQHCKGNGTEPLINVIEHSRNGNSEE